MEKKPKSCRAPARVVGFPHTSVQFLFSIGPAPFGHVPNFNSYSQGKFNVSQVSYLVSRNPALGKQRRKERQHLMPSLHGATPFSPAFGAWDR